MNLIDELERMAGFTNNFDYNDGEVGEVARRIDWPALLREAREMHARNAELVAEVEVESRKKRIACKVADELVERHAANLARLTAENAKLREVAKFPRNAFVQNGATWVGEWIAVPREDFDALRAAVAHGKEGQQ